MPLPGNLLTTAMAVMPHTDASQALEAAMSLDIPFWPQLPRLNYYEDMYVQASEHFPGIILDLDKQKLSFSIEPFEKESMDSLQTLLEDVWAVLNKKGIDTDYILSRSLISPATCCLVNPDGEKTVDKAFSVVRELSERLREKYGLI
jgi:hypothetical protein